MLLLEAELNQGIYWADIAINIVVGVISAVITAAVTSWMLDKAFRKSKYLGDSIKKAGIEKIDYTSGKMTQKDRNILFGLKGNRMPKELKLCFITGDNFCKDNFEALAKLAEEGCTIKMLIGNPNSCPRAEEYFKKFSENSQLEDLRCSDADKDALADLYVQLNELRGEELGKRSYLERTYLMVSKELIKNRALEMFGEKYENLSDEQKKKVWYARISANGDHVMQAVLVTRILGLVRKRAKNGGKVELRYYHDEYRIPITLAEYYAEGEDKENKLMLWTNMNAPVKETTKSVNVFGVDKFEEGATYVNDVNSSFEYLFDKYS